MLKVLFSSLFIQDSLAEERHPLPQMPLHLPPADTPYRVTVKFNDDTKMRALASGRLSSKSGAYGNWANEKGIRFRPLIGLDANALTRFERATAFRSGRAQPDFGGMMVAYLSPNAEIGPFEMTKALQAWPMVEYVHIDTLKPPPPIDFPPVTPDFTPEQTWQGAGNGLNITPFWDAQIKGQTIVVADIEYGVDAGHEDLVDQDIVFEANQTISSWVYDYGYQEHGTSVLGMTSAVENGYGVTGVLPYASVQFYPEWSDEEESRRASAIVSAAASLSPGDILMLEMQDYGDPGCGWELNCFVPAEINPDVWTATRAAVDAGIVVVAAAGNGDQDLDGQWYQDNYLVRGDSGAIIVGGGTLDHDYYGLNYGSRIDLQGWAEGIFTLGYATLAELDHDPLQTYCEFGGTSGATPMVAGVAGLLQDWANQHLGIPLSPEAVRQLIVDTAEPSLSALPLGDFPNAAALYETLNWLVFDQDEDGFVSAEFGGPDCNDVDSAIHPNAEDIPYDGVDSNCDGQSDFDVDGDGFDSSDYSGDDCDDSDPMIYPGAEDIFYDGIDSDCMGNSDFDADGDGFDSVDYNGEDCADDDPDRNPDANDIPYDAIDSDCSGGSDYDADGDGHESVDFGGLDCDDSDPLFHPNAEDIPNDGLDQDCDGVDAEPKWLGCASAGPPNHLFILFGLFIALTGRRRRFGD